VARSRSRVSAKAPQVVTSLESTQPVSIVTHLHDDGSVEVQVVDDATDKVLQRGICASDLHTESERCFFWTPPTLVGVRGI